jgi:sugar/nucleoside kinase (ribokinase family)
MGRGGSAANMAVVLGAHHDVVYVGVIGSDVQGELFVRDLRDAGVTTLLETLPGSTGVVVALVSSDGQRAMMTDRGVNSQLSLEAVQHALVEPFEHLHVSGYTILDDATREVGAAVLESARERGATTSVDVCSVGPLRQLGASVFRSAVGHVTMLFANEEESLALAEVPDTDVALDELATLANEVMVTRGNRGAVVLCNGEAFERPSRSLDIIDTTGAGDAASGAYLSARLSGLAIGEALEFAMLQASMVVGGLGSRG